MIFLIFFGLIIVVIVGLNIHDNSNISKIENYFKAQQCQPISYVSGQYRGICKDQVILMRNGFSVDVAQPEKLIQYKQIQNIKKANNTLVIETNNDSTSLEFKEAEKLEVFYTALQKKMKVNK